jgi:hypothetical protein
MQQDHDARFYLFLGRIVRRATKSPVSQREGIGGDGDRAVDQLS